MFGKNSIKSPKDYKDLNENEIKTTSIFYTIQGEGPFAGKIANFIRFTGCNLACSFCDAYFDTGDVMTFDEIYNKFQSKMKEFHDANGGVVPENSLVVLTGGEPMLQKNITQFLNYLHDKGFKTQIESNGTLLRDLPKETFLVVSPKATNQDYGPLRPDVYERADVLKFVVSADPSSPFNKIPDYAIEFAKNKEVYVSPMNIYTRFPEKVGNNAGIDQRSEVDERISFWTPGLLDYQKNQLNHEYAALLVMKYGFRLNIQQHLYANLP